MKQISILFFTLLLLGACVKAPTQTDNFVKIVDGRFSINDKPYYYIGTNFWYAAILGSQGQGGNRERLLKELDCSRYIENVGYPIMILFLMA